MSKLQFVYVTFPSSCRGYVYSAPSLFKLNPGDSVVVRTPDNSLKIVRVSRVIQDKDYDSKSFPKSKIKSIYAALDVI